MNLQKKLNSAYSVVKEKNEAIALTERQLVQYSQVRTDDGSAQYRALAARARRIALHFPPRSAYTGALFSNSPLNRAPLDGVTMSGEKANADLVTAEGDRA